MMRDVEIASFGFDTVKARYVLNEPLPTTDDSFMSEMVTMGWEPKIRQLFSSDDGAMLQSAIYLFKVNGTTLRYNIINAGREVTAEFSVPRHRDNSILNFNLATAGEVRASVEEVGKELKERLPEKRTMEVERLSRVDVAVDVYAEDTKQTLIRAAEHFRIPNAKKQDVVKHNHETTTIKSPSATFRVYDKATEALFKTKKLKLSKKEQQQLDTAERLGRVRMEYVYKQRGGYSLNALESMITSYADTLEKGFGGGVFQVEDLEGIRLKLDDLNINEMTRAKLYMFFVRRLFLGLEGTRDKMGRTAYFDAKKRIKEYGLFVGDLGQDNLSQYEGEINLKPVIEALRANIA